MDKAFENEITELVRLVPSIAGKALIFPDSVKSKDALFETDPEHIAAISGETAASFFTICASLASRRVTDEFKAGRRYTDTEIERFVIATFRGVFIESIYMLSFDSDGRMISSDFINEGTANYSEVVPMKLLERAKRRRAASVVIAHNHPLGDPIPSSADFTSTIVIEEILKESGIALKTHYVVAGSKARKITPEMLSANQDNKTNGEINEINV